MATPKSGPIPEPLEDGQHSIEQLQARYQALHTRKIQAEAHLSNARDQLAALKKQALENYGTDDIAELQQLLAQMKADNEQKRRDYQTQLDGIERELAAVEKNFSAAQEPAAAEKS